MKKNVNKDYFNFYSEYDHYENILCPYYKEYLNDYSFLNILYIFDDLKNRFHYLFKSNRSEKHWAYAGIYEGRANCLSKFFSTFDFESLKNKDVPSMIRYVSGLENKIDEFQDLSEMNFKNETYYQGYFYLGYYYEVLEIIDFLRDVCLHYYYVDCEENHIYPDNVKRIEIQYRLSEQSLISSFGEDFLKNGYNI